MRFVDAVVLGVILFTSINPPSPLQSSHTWISASLNWRIRKVDSVLFEHTVNRIISSYSVNENENE